MLAFVDPLNSYTVLIQSYQWGYTDGLEYVTRDLGTTPFGTSYRKATAYTTRTLQCRFVGIDDIINPLQTLTMIVQRHGGPVQFYPDATKGDYIWVQWPQEVPLGRVIENREEITLTLTEVGADVNPIPPYIPPTDLRGALVFTFTGDYPVGFCTADGIPVPSPNPAAFIGDHWYGNWDEHGIMVLDSGVFGVTGVQIGGVMRTQCWPADLSALAGETIGRLLSIATNRTDKFYGMSGTVLTPAPDAIPEHAGVLPQPPVPTGITVSATLGVESGGGFPAGFYEFGVQLYTLPLYPHNAGYPTDSDGNGAVILGPLASITVPSSTFGYLISLIVTFPNPATMDPYFAGGWYTVIRLNGAGNWRRCSLHAPINPSLYDGVVPYPGYTNGMGNGPGRFIGSGSLAIGIGNVSGPSPAIVQTNTTGTGPWYDNTLVEFDASGHLTGNTWMLYHRESQGGDPMALAVNRAVTVAYFSHYDAIAYAANSSIYDVISKNVLSTGAMSTFATLPNYYIYTANSIRVLDSGQVLVLWTHIDGGMVVKRYSSAGTVLATYPITATGAAEAYEGLLAHGADDSSFWVCYTYDSPAPDYNIDHLVNIDVATGAVLHSFDSPWFVPPWFTGDDWEFRFIFNPFCVIPNGSGPSTAPVSTPVVVSQVAVKVLVSIPASAFVSQVVTKVLVGA